MNNISEKIDLSGQELTLLAILFGIAFTMFAISLTYSRTAALFPQLTSAFVMIGIVLVLAHRALPEPIRTIVIGESAAFEREEFKDMDATEGKETDARKRASVSEESDHPFDDDKVFISLLFGGYVLLGYLIGLLWATPLFVYVYGKRHGQPKRVVWSLVALSTVLAFVFLIFLNLPLETGVLHELAGIA